MQSNLKKSLYLGLAALSFASVASATNASSANAAKKHSHKRVAKKVTYKTTNKNLDQSVVFQATGKNAVYNKPAGKRSVVATKADMASKANSNKSSDYFMAYQEAQTSKGVHYYKVVSFDKKIRGYVYVGGVNKTQGSTDTSSKYNFKDAAVYLKHNRLFNNAYGTVFGAKRVNVNNANIGDKFSVDKAVTNRDGWTYFHVTDANPSVGNLVSGWVNESNLTNSTKDSLQNTSNLVKVNFVNDSGNVVKSANLPSNIGDNGNYDAKINSTDKDNDVYNVYTISNAVNNLTSSSNKDNPLRGTGYSYSSDVASPYYYNNMAAMNNVAKGSTVTIKVAKDSNNDKQAYVNFKLLDSNNKPANGDQPVDMSSVKTGSFNLNTSGLKGDANTFFNLSTVENNLFNQGQPLNIIKVGDKTYAFNAKYTNTNTANKGLFDIYGALNNNVLFGDINEPVNAYYSEVNSSNSALIPAAGQNGNNTPSDITNGNGVDATTAKNTKQTNLSNIAAAAKNVNDKLANNSGEGNNSFTSTKDQVNEIRKALSDKGFKSSDISAIQQLINDSSNASSFSDITNFNNFKAVVNYSLANTLDQQ